MFQEKNLPLMVRPFPIFCLFSLFATDGTSGEFTPDQLDFFEKRIRPVLAEKCFECHSAQSEKLKSGLQVDHRAHLLKGGGSGQAIDLESPKRSLLVETIRYANPDLQMPPKEKLSAEVVSDFEKWIADGAAWPEEEVPERGEEAHAETFDLEKRKAEHWSWRPIEKPAVPPVKNPNWSSSPIDHFILHRIERAGLKPAEPADDRTWLRRVTFDLTGLPPGLPEIAGFLEDRSDDRKERVIDRLLASPHFGEKWARHWMDLVRYAETYGHEFDYPIDYAHEYRDYLIRAFNADVPFDQFAKEHIAGDLIEEPRLNPEDKFNESVIGTSFWYLHEATHAPTDVLADESDHHDNQIDTFAKSFLGLTVACARCHDHKFDAISTADYYALTGYLHSSARTEKSLDPDNIRKETAERQKRILKEANTSFQPPAIGETAPYFRIAADLIREEFEDPANPAKIPVEVFADFENGYGDWKLTGSAFAEEPVSGSVGNQKPIVGATTGRFASSFTSSPDEGIGELTSPEFEIRKDFINFRIGGGEQKTTALRLYLDGKKIRTASGRNADQFHSVSWDVSDFVGKTVHLQLVDEEKRGGRHILLDDVTFSDEPSPLLPMPSKAAIANAALANSLERDRLEEICHFLQSPMKQPSLAGTDSLERWVLEPEYSASMDRRIEHFRKQSEDFTANSRVYEDFNSDTLPGGWSASGEGFLLTGNSSAYSLRENAPFTIPGVIDSGLLGEAHNGTLRSPTFTIDTDSIHIRMRSEHALVRVVIDNYHMAKFNSLLFRGTTLKDVSTEGEFTWQTIGGNLEKYLGHRAYLEFVDAGPGSIEIDEIRFADGGAPNGLPSSPLPALIPEHSASDAMVDTLFANWLSQSKLLTIANQQVAKRIDEGSALSKDLPTDRFAITMAEGTPENAFVYVRGSHRTAGEEVPPRFLEALGAREGNRMTLAEEVVSPQNPLTSRVLVNRLWHHVFGKGIVPTVDDFGPMGQVPTHPELLDWLASDFVGNEWSIKQTLRKIVLSNTYGQSGLAHPDLEYTTVASIDPTNTLLHHMPVKRLSAEAIRDSILAVSGSLDETMYGPSIPTHRTAFMTGRGGRQSGPLDGAGRRSVYGSIYRNFLHPFLLAFDMPNPFGPNGRRSVSNVPAQALALMNDPFVVDQSKKWTSGNLASDPDLETDARIARMFEQLTAVPPDDKTLARLRQFLDAQSKEYGTLDQKAWSDLAHALFNTKSFLYLN